MKKLIWNGDLCWFHSDGREPDCEEFDWLINYLVDKVGHDKADETGDVLLVLSAVRGLGSPTKRSSYIESLIRCMGSTTPRVRHAALGTVYEVRGELASITGSSMPEGIDADLLDKLSVALFTIHPDDELNASRNLKYIHIIFAMTKNYQWCQRLASHDHLQRCINLVTANGVQMYERDVGFYLTVVIGRLYYKDSRFDSHPTQSHPWWTLIKNTWIHPHLSVRDDDYINGIPALATATRSCIFSGTRLTSVKILLTT
ncbi:hypothetical protein BDR07DRAFT_1020099 [Suillus spraguei]|nr:hypothetical protein BDR07DRAFT_1020099 [Suillus spraguei]